MADGRDLAVDIKQEFDKETGPGMSGGSLLELICFAKAKEGSWN